MNEVLDRPAVAPNLSITLLMTPEIQSSLRQGEGYVEVARAYEITNYDDAQLAVNERNTCLKAIDKLELLRKGFLKPAQEIIDNAKALFNPAILGYQESAKLLSSRITTWEQQEKQRIDAENRAREDAARQARQAAEATAAAERARAEEIAAQQRQKAAEAERQRQEAEAAGNKRAAAAAAAAKAKAEEAEKAAIENGDAKAHAAQMGAAAITTAAPEATQQKLAGNTMRENFVAKLKPGITEDEAKRLIAWECAERPELLAMLSVNGGALNRMAKALRGAFNVPGYEARDEPIAAGKRS